MASHPLSALKTLSGALLNKIRRFAELTGEATYLEKLEEILDNDDYAKSRWEAGSHIKTDRLIEELPKLVKKHGRVVIYMEFRETQKVIVQRLSKTKSVGLPPKTAIISYHGSLTLAEKARQVERFNNNKNACFISTDAGGQGLNLQAGNVVLNFDFPWNPMRVEQRIGRVDRIGQVSDSIVVKNFITRGTIEQYVYRTLRKRLKVCEDVLGSLVPQIFNLRGIDQKYCTEEDVLGIGQIILASQNEKDLRQKFLALERNLDEQISRHPTAWQYQRKWLDG